MLALAIDLLFATAAVVAVLTLADTGLKARRAYDRLMREKALLDADLALATQAVRTRSAARRVAAMPGRRAPLLQPVPVRAAA